jgi:hypothetical protein
MHFAVVFLNNTTQIIIAGDWSSNHGVGDLFFELLPNSQSSVEAIRIQAHCLDFGYR